MRLKTTLSRVLPPTHLIKVIRDKLHQMQRRRVNDNESLYSMGQCKNYQLQGTVVFTVTHLLADSEREAST